ncbi:MAG: TetR/AcrR family transcriptional regulator [Desulfuromonas sp.]|nr:MAG: TetR/AcrR family transcriptional regulator [Desulfuromonas sp.]
MIQPSETKTRILDAAERCFALSGYHGASLRAITRDANVNLAAVNYHFGSKEGLIEAVFCRRILPLNEERKSLLQQELEAASCEDRLPSSGVVLKAFIEPTISLWRKEENADFLLLLGRMFNDSDETMRQIFFRHMTPLLDEFYVALQVALPQLSSEQVFWRLQFALGSLGHLMCRAGRLLWCPAGVDCGDDPTRIADHLLDFLVPAMEA